MPPPAGSFWPGLKPTKHTETLLPDYVAHPPSHETAGALFFRKTLFPIFGKAVVKKIPGYYNEAIPPWEYFKGG